MSYKTLAAINVGSGEVSMKIYEISRKTGIREIDLAVILIRKAISNMILSENCVMFWNAFP